MRLGSLLLREMRLRWVGTLLLVLAIAAAVFGVLAGYSNLIAHDHRTDEAAEALKERAEERMADLADEARRFAKSLGHNAWIYHREDDLARFQREDRTTVFLDMADATALADANTPYLNHLLPLIRQRYTVAGLGEVIVVGIDGQIHIKRAHQKPIQEDVPPGIVDLGHAVARRSGLATGDSLTIGDTTYTVRHIREPEGTREDDVVIMHLAAAQELLGHPGKISGILALTCNCEAGQTDLIRGSLRTVDPVYEVVEFAVLASARQRARKAVAVAAREELADLQATRTVMRNELLALARLLGGLAGAITLALVAVVSLDNVRARQRELAVLRAMGVRSGGIFILVLGKAILLGIVGAFLGWLLAILVFPAYAPGVTALAVALIASSAASMLACWFPALDAATRDPAWVLNEGAL